MHFPKKLKSFARAFLKARSFQRQSLWSLSAESETLLGEAQHLFFSQRRILSAAYSFFSNFSP